MRYRLNVADAATGEEHTIEINAETADEARNEANDAGFLVASLVPLSEPPIDAVPPFGEVGPPSSIDQATEPQNPQLAFNERLASVIGGDRSSDRKPWEKHPLLSIIAIVAVVSLLLISSNQSVKAPKADVPLSSPQDSANPAPEMGKEAFLKTPKGAPVPLAATKEDLARLVTYTAAKDEFGIGEMIESGKIWFVPSGTKCLLIDPGIFQHEVRITSGDSRGRSGWVPNEFVSG